MNNSDFPEVSIIIVNYNGKQFLAECLNSLELLEYPADKIEIILVDNNSSDGSTEFTAENYPRVKIIKLDNNYGFCRPNNVGVSASKGEYVALLNNDTVVTPKWLSELVKTAKADKNIACCASKILYYERQNIINAAGGKITVIGGGIYGGYGRSDGPKYNVAGPTGFGCGAGVLVKKEFYQRIGGFDEKYFASCEENDLGWKSWLLGFRVVYVPDAVMYHHESGTFGSRSTYESRKVYYITRNRLYNIVKNMEMPTVIRAMLISCGFNLYRSLKFLFSGNFTAIGAVLRAYLDFWRNLKYMVPQRKIVLRNRVLSDKELYRIGVIATLGESISEEIRIGKLSRNEFYRI